MAKGFSIQHLASTPHGWHVRTVKAGAHRVRVAFPPGRRKKGSGIPVEVLHPRGENSACFKNPAELLLMGANPIGGKKSSPYDSLTTDEKLAFGRLGLGKTQLRTAADIRRARAEVRKVSNFRNSFANPGTLPGIDSENAQQARELSEKFHDRKWEFYKTLNEPHIPEDNYPLLAMFVSLAVKPTEKSSDPIRQVREIYFPNGRTIRVIDRLGNEFDHDASDVMILCAPSGHPLYLTNEQEMDEEDLQLFGAGPEDPCRIGEARAIAYIDKKWHPEANIARGKSAIYQHPFADQGGTRPQVFYSRSMKRLILKGGSYHVEAAGIVN